MFSENVVDMEKLINELDRENEKADMITWKKLN